ncbi:MAG: nucleotidyltransferase domain-containing protein [Bacteroidetes bacterium]|nr:nucleotidyltransferase domain-containing protein [Bacteroidota bacterium]MBS1670316.1 nucleotidyltransferase domain-containing protein [Bacteroidota bacterium]
MQSDNIITKNLLQIQQLMRDYGVEKAYAFGSAVKGTMHEKSDVDFVIKFPDDMHYETYADNYFALAHALENLLHKNVDLVAEKTLQNPYLIQSINNHKMEVL